MKRSKECSYLEPLTKPQLRGRLGFNSSEFQPVYEVLLETLSECAEEIARIGGGISHAKQIGNRYLIGSAPWHIGIKNAPATEAENISKALAEWADGDAVAAHVGYKNDYFCTRDEGKSAGLSSVLSPQNRAILESKFGVKFISPESLCNLIA